MFEVQTVNVIARYTFDMLWSEFTYPASFPFLFPWGKLQQALYGNQYQQ